MSRELLPAVGAGGRSDYSDTALAASWGRMVHSHHPSPNLSAALSSFMSTPPELSDAQWMPLAARVTTARNADVFLYHGPIERPHATRFCRLVLQQKRRPNALLLLMTFGGSGDAAYRMARGLQDSYTEGRVAVLVTSYCKSAGTLLALGANELVMSELAELGPLDVQITKPDDLSERTSGLTPTQSLSTLREGAFQCFESFFLEILESSGYAITTKTAALIAARMTSGLFRPVYAQIDPMRLGEFQRAVQIALEYGKRLDSWAKNLKDKAIGRLIASYPSHDFVIDRREAETLFKTVSRPTDAELKMAEALAPIARIGMGTNDACIRYLSPEQEGQSDGSGTSKAPPGTGAGAAGSGGAAPRIRPRGGRAAQRNGTTDRKASRV